MVLTPAVRQALQSFQFLALTTGADALALEGDELGALAR